MAGILHGKRDGRLRRARMPGVLWWRPPRGRACGPRPCRQKTATASSAIAYRTENEPFPEAGCLSVILFDSGEAACVIRDTKISVVPFDKVSAEHAFKEGEGDRSLGYRRAVHEAFFAPDYAAAGLPFDPHGDCVLEAVEIVYPGSKPD